MASDSLELLACQLDIPATPSVAARDAHLERAQALIEHALDESPADLVVLPELASIDYSEEAFAELDSLAEDFDGPSCTRWCDTAKRHDCVIVFGFPRRTASGQFRISVAVADLDGTIRGCYDKIFLAQFGASMEKDYFCPGEQLFCFDIGEFRFAPIICADIRFPELCRTLVVSHGANVILHCGAYYRDPSFYSWHNFAKTRALENQVYFVSVNRAGSQYGDSLIVPPWVDKTTHPLRFAQHDEHLQRFSLDHKLLNSVRLHYPFLADRRSFPDQPYSSKRPDSQEQYPIG